jgi:hypothetical protein
VHGPRNGNGGETAQRLAAGVRATVQATESASLISWATTATVRGAWVALTTRVAALEAWLAITTSTRAKAQTVAASERNRAWGLVMGSSWDFRPIGTNPIAMKPS